MKQRNFWALLIVFMNVGSLFAGTLTGVYSFVSWTTSFASLLFVAIEFLKE